jgi:hypothetical protein
MKKRMLFNLLVAVLTLVCFQGAYADDRTADEIAKDLSNPATPTSSLGNNFEYKAFKGDLPGAEDQESWSYTFQPSFPFSVGEGKIIAFRPAFPVLIQQPVFDGAAGSFKDEEWEFGDISFDFVYGGTSSDGIIKLGGLFGVLPTHSTETVGSDQWRFGPEFLLGMLREWGVLAFLAFHQWDVTGGDDEPATSVTSFQYIYAYGLGDGWQIASGPTIVYDWEADSDNAWTVPLGVGVSKTVIAGKTPIKMQLQFFYNIEQPDDFGQDYGVKLSVSPVVANPFAK